MREVRRLRAFKVDVPEEAGAEPKEQLKSAKPWVPQPLCKVVWCDDVEGITLEEALREMAAREGKEI